MEDLVQLHTRVKPSTKEIIQRIAKAKRCQMGAVIDEAIRLYEQKKRKEGSWT